MAEPASTELSDVRKERFNLNLFYLKSEESVHKFIRKLPGTIKFIDAKRLERDDIHTYADHKISYNVIFESSMDNALVLSEVLKLWEINLRSIESMSWLQLLPRKRLSCMSPQQSREILEKVEILGGSMISPINFVRHWETVASVANFNRTSLCWSLQTLKLRWK
ncbi:uncharacterized protein LOC134231637 [Saccostrea cucullata]|uniref:uncharacterized protein LOC134231637 n=1 Tax=Saccostrea cuccullata TaxID=36930 RepID=UPI002ED1D0DE